MLSTALSTVGFPLLNLSFSLFNIWIALSIFGFLSSNVGFPLSYVVFSSSYVSFTILAFHYVCFPLKISNKTSLHHQFLSLFVYLRFISGLVLLSTNVG